MIVILNYQINVTLLNNIINKITMVRIKRGNVTKTS
jgi:hypothetical protein